jgi:hypothetical protein
MLKKPKKFYRKATPKNENQELRIKNQGKDSSQNLSSKDMAVRNEKNGSSKQRVMDSGQARMTIIKESPKNNRSITENPKNSFKKDDFWHDKTTLFILILVGVLSLAGIGYIGTQAKQQYLRFEKVDAERKQLETKLNQLQETAISHPGSRDIYL